MNIWEFFSFLVNNNEINNPNIIKYFKDNLKSGSDSFFNKYPEHKSKGDSMKEVKELLKKVGGLNLLGNFRNINHEITL